jgi:hypothetical protein
MEETDSVQPLAVRYARSGLAARGGYPFRGKFAG